MTVKKIVGGFVKAVLALVVLAFLGLKSLDFFTYVTPAEQWYYAYLGFGLTSGAVVGYLIVFLWDADTSLKRSISIMMLVISLLGEIATAGFGIQLNAMAKNGFVLTQSDFDWMILAIQILGFIHGLALVGYVAGDEIGKAFKDDDGDGTINMLDPIDDRTGEPTKGLNFSGMFKRNKKHIPQPVGQLSTTFMSDDEMARLADIIIAKQSVGQGGTTNPQSAPRLNGK